MIDSAKMAHDLAIAFVTYKLNLAVSDGDSSLSEADVFEWYKSSHDEFYSLRND